MGDPQSGLVATGIRLVGPGLAGPLGPGRQTGSSYSEILHLLLSLLSQEHVYMKHGTESGHYKMRSTEVGASIQESWPSCCEG